MLLILISPRLCLSERRASILSHSCIILCLWEVVWWTYTGWIVLGFIGWSNSNAFDKEESCFKITLTWCIMEIVCTLLVPGVFVPVFMYTRKVKMYYESRISPSSGLL